MAIVCNLIFNTPSCVAINASSPGIADGQIIVSALDGSNPATVKYNLNSDFTYPFGQTSGTFSGLLPGTYTVYARNSTSCRATIVLIVGYVSEYAIRYRLPFKDPYDNQYKLEIEDSEYESATVNELIGRGEAPVRIVHRGESNEDVFYHVVSSLIEVSIISLTDQQYIDFYTFDERRFRAKVYKWNGSSYDLYHVGYLTPMLYSEPYVLKEGYEINLVFTDGLADLKDYEFTDDSGNIPQDRIPIFNALNYIINKTDIELNIWESVNIFASVMDSGTDDSMLEQAYIDPKNYLNTDGTIKNCAEVLSYLLEFMGARLYQANGRWNIDLVSEKTATNVPYRKRTSNYGVIAGGNENPRYLLRRSTAESPRITFKDQSQVMKIPQTYGTVQLTYDLGIEDKNNLLDYGDFNDEDLVNGQLKGWKVDLENAENASIGLESYDVDKNALFIDFDITQPSESVLLSANPIDYEWPNGAHKVKLLFDVYTRPIYSDLWIYFDYSLKLVNSGLPITYRLQPDFFTNSLRYMDTPTNNLQDGDYNRVFITEHLTWKTISADIYIFQTSFSGSLELDFLINSNQSYQYSSVSELQAVAVGSDKFRLYNNKARVLLAGGLPGFENDEILFYDLIRENLAEDVPNVLYPVDFNSSTNPYCWKLQKRVAFPTVFNADDFAQSLLQSFLIRNVRLEYYPNNGEKPIEEITITEVVNNGLKNKLEKTIFHGDIQIPPLDNNYQYLSNAYLTESDGTPIYGGWARKGVTENYSSSELLAKMIRGQYQERRWMLTGEVMCPDGMLSFWNTIHEVRTGKIYQLISLVQNLKEGFAEIESIETLSGGDPLDESTDPGGDPGPIEPPVETRVHSSDFSTDFN